MINGTDKSLLKLKLILYESCSIYPEETELTSVKWKQMFSEILNDLSNSHWFTTTLDFWQLPFFWIPDYWHFMILYVSW